MHWVGATSSTDLRSTVDAATLAQRWGKSLATAASTLQASTTTAVRFCSQMEEFSRRLRTFGLKWYTDTMFPKDKVKLVKGHICAELSAMISVGPRCIQRAPRQILRIDSMMKRFNDAIILQYGRIPELGAT